MVGRFPVGQKFLRCACTKHFKPPATIPIYHKDGLATEHTTSITGSSQYTALAEPNQQLFKQATEEDHVVTTTSSIFHPQGGGQPSDVGKMATPDNAVAFDVTSVRQDAVTGREILHLGRYSTSSSRHFQASETVQQTLDAENRHLYSRLHTAGHVLGLAARHYLEAQGETGFEDGKASHFPGMANVEFIGLIDGKHKAGIQAKVDEYVEADMPVEIYEWSDAELRNPANRVYMHEAAPAADEGGKLRCVSVVGAGAYPCGGTHVRSTKECGKVKVYKISRQKGITRVSYSLD